MKSNTTQMENTYKKKKKKKKNGKKTNKINVPLGTLF